MHKVMLINAEDAVISFRNLTLYITEFMWFQIVEYPER